MMKRLSAIILSAVMLLSLCACGQKSIGDCADIFQKDIKWEMTIEDIEESVEFDSYAESDTTFSGEGKIYTFENSRLLGYKGKSIYRIDNGHSLHHYIFQFDNHENYVNFCDEFTTKYGKGKTRKITSKTKATKYIAEMDGKKSIITLLDDGIGIDQYNNPKP